MKNRLRECARLVLGIGLALAVTGCKNPNSYPKINDQEQLSPVMSTPVEINGKMYIPVEESYCLSRTYRIQEGYIGPVGRVLELGIEECNKIIGRAPREYGVYATWLENMRVWLNGFTKRKRH